MIIVAAVAATGNTSAVALFALGKGTGASAERSRSSTDRIVEAHGGSIAIEAPASGGTTVLITLPAPK